MLDVPPCKRWGKIPLSETPTDKPRYLLLVLGSFESAVACDRIATRKFHILWHPGSPNALSQWRVRSTNLPGSFQGMG